MLYFKIQQLKKVKNMSYGVKKKFELCRDCLILNKPSVKDKIIKQTMNESIKELCDIINRNNTYEWKNVFLGKLEGFFVDYKYDKGTCCEECKYGFEHKVL
jgi:hypothetical protein